MKDRNDLLARALHHQAEEVVLNPSTFENILTRWKRRLLFNAFLAVSTAAVIIFAAMFTPSVFQEERRNTVVPGPTPSPSEQQTELCGASAPPPTTAKPFVPASNIAEGRAFTSVTFPDGSHAVVEAPVDLGLHQMAARPDISGGSISGRVRPTISYSGTLTQLRGPVDCVRGVGGADTPVWENNPGERLMVLRFGSWYVQIEEKPGVRLAFWARGLSGDVTQSGWLLLSGRGGLQMGPQRAKGDSAVVFYDQNNTATIWIGRCVDGASKMSSVGRTALATFCPGTGNVEIHAQGDPTFVRHVLDEVRVRNVETKYPLTRYVIVP